MQPDPAQALVIAAEAAARSPHSHLARCNLNECLLEHSEAAIINHASRSRTARVYLSAAKVLARSEDPQERDAMAAIILSLAKSRWRQAQAPRPYRPPRADIYA